MIKIKIVKDAFLNLLVGNNESMDKKCVNSAIILFVILLVMAYGFKMNTLDTLHIGVALGILGFACGSRCGSVLSEKS